MNWRSILGMMRGEFMIPYILLGVLALGVLVVVALVIWILRWRLRIPAVEAVSNESCPPDHLEALRPLADQLRGAGMIFGGLQKERRDGQEYWQALFRSEDGTVWAVAERTVRTQPRLVLHSFFPEGRGVTTSSGEYADYNVTEDWKLTEQNWEDFGAQQVFHRQSVLGRGTGLMELTTLAEFQLHYMQVLQGQFGYLQQKRFLVAVPSTPGTFRVAPWNQPVIAIKMLFHSLGNKLAERGRKLDRQYQAEMEVERAERRRYGKIGEYKYLEFYKEDKKRGSSFETLGWTKLGAVLFMTIAAMLLFFYAQGAIDLTTVVIIAGVLLFHDLGHLAMMILFGYRDIHVMVIPVLARLAKEKNMRVPGWQEFAVLLMGPLPGLLLGWGLLIWGHFDPTLPEIWREAGFWLALINNLNFLAVLPAEGGRVINLLVFERIPALRLIYLILSACSVISTVLVYLLVFDTFLWPVLLVLISTFLAIPDNWRHAKMGPWAKHNLRPDDSENDALMKAFQIVESTDSTRGLEKRGWTNFVDRVVRYGCSKKLGFVGTAVCLILFYFFLFTPIYVFFGLAISDAMVVKAQGEHLEERLEELEPPDNGKAVALEETTRQALDQLLASRQNELFQAQLDAISGAGFRFEAAADETGGESQEVGIEVVRSIKWNQAITWAAEEESLAREDAIAYGLRRLLESARTGIDAGEVDTPLSDLSKAWWGLVSCEPRTSLGAWIDWLYLEQEMLQELERVTSKRALPAHYSSWFIRTLEEGPQAQGSKLAYLLLRDLQAKDAIAGVAVNPEPVKKLGDLFSGPGFRLRRSRVDEEYEVKAAEEWPHLRMVMAASRTWQGLPTAEDYHAGLIVAEHWRAQREVGSVPLEDLTNDEQRSRWTARLNAIQRMLAYRKLGLAALQIEREEQSRRAGRHGLTRGNHFGVPVRMEEGGRGQFKLSSTAPDGTVLTWQLSPDPLQ